MPHYFFDIVADGDVFRDEEGALLQDLRLAHRHAGDLVAGTYSLLGGANLFDWRVDIRTACSTIALIVPFSFFGGSAEHDEARRADPVALASARLLAVWLAKRHNVGQPEYRRG